MKLTNHLSRVIEDHIYNLADYQKEIQKDIKLGGMNRTLYLQDVRLRELQRITQAIEQVFNELAENKQEFIATLFLEGRTPTIQAAAEQTFTSLSTAKRIKKEFIESIAVKLGWI
ncbi:hypothetical protein PGH26_13700 [Sporosarcina jeotgali]|uniref:RNA polymerase sigma-70 region 4 domain-containing protein n=1 Tax=Sporosarcina jeotgali TaxID=3020056 RepID=A0ABZ0KU02_9BACL|nr:hypothetical protein [Sporosarcina sp. B2O-1]WOV83919.1 hypothetical protein PGH26_13700 [Sporosarcina sp. B2O-1]